MNDLGTNITIAQASEENTEIPRSESLSEGASERLRPETSEELSESIFSASLPEKIFSLLMFPIAFLYVHVFFSGDAYLWIFAAFTLVFLAAAEILFYKRRRTAESIVFLVSCLVILGGFVFGKRQVWNELFQMFFLHLFGVYFVLCRSDRLLAGKSGSLLLLDGIHAFFIRPFTSYFDFLQTRTIGTIFRDRIKKSDENKVQRIPFIVIAILTGALLLRMALMMLTAADAEYASLMMNLANLIKVDLPSAQVLLEISLTLLVSPYLYGIFGSCVRESEEECRAKGRAVYDFLEKCRKVPQMVWILLISLFTAFYTAFFFIQARTMLPTFLLQLPQGMTYAENAHAGFGYMCGVNLINFVLLYLASRSSEHRTMGLRSAIVLMTLENMLFSVIAFLKLYIYIRAFGFTPLRMQSIWLASVLLYAGICILVHVFTGKETVRAWFLGSAVSLAVLCVF